MKSALEIALEKTASAQESGKLTEKQRSTIGDLEKEYQAKIAEQEIMVESKIKLLAAQATGPEFQEQVHALREKLLQERERLEEDKKQKIQSVREQAS
jgi:molybdopterin converting factor small subunit